MARKKLQKLIGKVARYSGIVEEVSDNSRNLLVLDVQHEGKVYTDHAWLNRPEQTYQFEKGMKVYFNGVARTYIDSKGVRKNGIRGCHKFRTEEEENMFIFNPKGKMSKRSWEKGDNR